ncbi:MAG: hypothetical protein KC777_27750 [Cyanobacteria bacterium HKST-UBA02]|nr:hypothetical protein [Cyanobacteria bacterium HKST-UBA02]
MEAVSDIMAFQTPQQTAEVLQLIEASVFKTPRQAQMSTTHGVCGRVKNNEFVLTRVSNARNGFARDLHGVVLEDEYGSRVEYRFEVSMIIRIMFTLWFVLVAALMVAGIVFIVKGEPRLELIVVPVVLLGGGVAMVSYGITRGREQEKELEQFLRRTVTGQNRVGF